MPENRKRYAETSANLFVKDPVAARFSKKLRKATKPHSRGVTEMAIDEIRQIQASGTDGKDRVHPAQ